MNSFNKILVIRFSSIGDIILTSPLLRILRKKFPDSCIDFVVRSEYSELIRYNPYINNIFEFNVQSGWQGLKELKNKFAYKKYDLLIDLQNNIRSIYIRMLVKGPQKVVVNKNVMKRLALVILKKNFYKEILPVPIRYIRSVAKYGLEYDGAGLDLFINDDDYYRVDKDVSMYGINEANVVIGFCPSARHKTKCWPKEYFVELGVKIAQMYKAKIIIFGSNLDKKVCNEIATSINECTKSNSSIDLSGKYTLLETAAFMRYCNCVITNDTGLMHVASAMKRKVVAIFGSTVKEFGFVPFGTENIIVEKDIACRPCSHIGKEKCPKKHFNCMKEITADSVLIEVEKLINNKQKV